MDEQVELRRLERSEVPRVGEIDRTERIDGLYDQRGTALVVRSGEWIAPAWDADGDGEHTVEAKVREVLQYLDGGGVAVGAIAGGALAGGRMVGLGVVVPHLRPGLAQLAFLHVSAPWRAAGIGSSLCERLEEHARDAGDVEMVVSATPSANTVRFYLGRGFEPTADPVPELVELEPDDVHMRKAL